MSPHESATSTRLVTAGSTTAARPSSRGTIGRWLISFIGFPVGGLAAILLTGPVDSVPSALAGGAVTGGILGAVQAWATGTGRPRVGPWAGATAAGLALGLSLGSALVDYRTDLASLVVQGAVSGFLVGVAQAAVLLPRTGRAAAVWPIALSVAWPVGWLVTNAVIGLHVEDQFIVFGSSGALVVTLLTAPLPLLLASRYPVTPHGGSSPL